MLVMISLALIVLLIWGAIALMNTLDKFFGFTLCTRCERHMKKMAKRYTKKKRKAPKATKGIKE